MAKIADFSVDDRIRGIIESTVRERLSDLDVVRVNIRKEIDLDEEQVLAVYIALADNTNLSKIRTEALSGLVRHIRSSLADVDNYIFPVVRMMTQKELELVNSGS
jgi:hypothetical protein